MDRIKVLDKKEATAKRQLEKQKTAGFEKELVQYLQEFKQYYTDLDKKNKSWIENMKTTIGTKIKDINEISAQGRMSKIPGAETKVKRQISSHAKDLTNRISMVLNLNYETNKTFFLKTHRKKHLRLNQYYQEVSKEFQNKDIVENYNLFLQNVAKSNGNFYTEAKKVLTDELETTGAMKRILGELDGGDAMVFQADMDKLFSNTTKYNDKIKNITFLNYNIIDMIIDKQFYLILSLKVLRILFSYLAAHMAGKMFIPYYEEYVYEEKKNPPELWKFMLIYLGFDLGLNVFIICILFTLMYLFKTDGNTFLIDKFLFQKYVLDYMISTAVIVIAGMMIAQVMMQKKYFKYKYEGARAVRALQSMVFKLSIPIYLVPFFFMV